MGFWPRAGLKQAPKGCKGIFFVFEDLPKRPFGKQKSSHGAFSKVSPKFLQFFYLDRMVKETSTTVISVISIWVPSFQATVQIWQLAITGPYMNAGLSHRLCFLHLSKTKLPIMLAPSAASTLIYNKRIPVYGFTAFKTLSHIQVSKAGQAKIMSCRPLEYLTAVLPPAQPKHDAGFTTILDIDKPSFSKHFLNIARHLSIVALICGWQGGN